MKINLHMEIGNNLKILRKRIKKSQECENG